MENDPSAQKDTDRTPQLIELDKNVLYRLQQQRTLIEGYLDKLSSYIKRLVAYEKEKNIQPRVKLPLLHEAEKAKGLLEEKHFALLNEMDEGRSLAAMNKQLGVSVKITEIRKVAGASAPYHEELVPAINITVGKPRKEVQARIEKMQMAIKQKMVLTPDVRAELQRRRLGLMAVETPTSKQQDAEKDGSHSRMFPPPLDKKGTQSEEQSGFVPPINPSNEPFIPLKEKGAQ